MRYALVLMAAATLAACASTTGHSGKSEYERLEKECRERGGILTPIPGAHNANEAANYACEIRGPAPRGE